MNALSYVLLIAAIVTVVISLSSRKLAKRQHAALLAMAFVIIGVVFVTLGFFGLVLMNLHTAYIGLGVFIGGVLGSLLVIKTRKEL
ncbi:hypothetical protein [Caryophanon latum]|uniref:Uncharacterized protein n=1 Tax=Caryophanon latum TaxID=33977 RepID=A0A1C0YPW1_9BACL|nr:hypothetical protein [Caryophanon latum]OCS89210.1 hypothetical protein A6K76_12720 [Caryophanon latum]